MKCEVCDNETKINWGNSSVVLCKDHASSENEVPLAPPLKKDKKRLNQKIMTFVSFAILILFGFNPVVMLMSSMDSHSDKFRLLPVILISVAFGLVICLFIFAEKISSFFDKNDDKQN